MAYLGGQYKYNKANWVWKYYGTIIMHSYNIPVYGKLAMDKTPFCFSFLKKPTKAQIKTYTLYDVVGKRK